MYIAQTYSTNTLLREQYTEAMPDLYTVRTDYQTAGRGQAGNSWESEAGKNLLCSTLMRWSDKSVGQAFEVNMAVSLAVWHVLNKTVKSDEWSVKWPNDIYYGDKKIAGILVENFVQDGRIDHSIAGVGLNVNQTEWQSDAPNPLSLKQITQQTYDLNALHTHLLEELAVWKNVACKELKAQYKAVLYHREGLHYYVEREVDATPTMNATGDTQGAFEAEIVDITDTGELVLRSDGKEQAYHYKQIRYVV